MSTKLIAWGIIGLIVIGGGWYAFSQQHMFTPAEQALETSNKQGEAGAFNGSLADLSARGGSWKCLVDTTAITGAGTMNAQGVVYVLGKKVRADFVVEAPIVGAVTTYMIADGADVYSWSSIAPTGVKSPMQQSETEDSQTNVPTVEEQAGPYNNYTYDCQPSTVEASLFVVPNNITFTEVNP